jgi:hypothetical protein
VIAVMSAVGEKGEPSPGDSRPSEGVVVDIGGDTGALVVHTTPDFDEVEIHICPVGTGSRTHTVVRARHLPSGDVVYAGVFPSLPAGDYTLLAPVETVVHVDGGAVTEASW